VQTVHKVAPAYSAPKAVYAPSYGGYGPSYASPKITYAGEGGYGGGYGGGY
jgi:hypothetical protein